MSRMIKIVLGIVAYTLLSWARSAFPSYESYFLIAKILLISAVILRLVIGLRRAPQELSLKGKLISFVENNLGNGYTRYLEFELLMIKGSLKFFSSPLQSWKRIKASYFYTDSLAGLFFGIIFLVICESLIIHLLVHLYMPDEYIFVSHVAVLLFDIYFLEMILGNLYYLPDSEVSIGDKDITVKLGILSSMSVKYEDIKELVLPEDGLEKRPPKIGLLGSRTLQLHFHTPQIWRFFSVEKRTDRMDLCLKENDCHSIRESWLAMDPS
ncbi:MAG: hypothetical protein HRU19_03805 [Pseudobacteriovorax sp.]|nr:hypothetical protein [Pseudobacteriovorax sp.]